ncbi:hypothetical protein EVAR_42948_1 [Eumeta japonica]|uniref:FLYWCH-type domain-containing protein n=1 Tax=Eumeta variegata TaxID=151549 RepID=A0A4C1YCG2_EUMVA|nr:hypothetical protein EVAR_42948_1 [Eumeta japonica]
MAILPLSDLPYELIPSRRGKRPLLLFDNHTFSQIGGPRNWYCSKKDRLSCKAKVNMDNEGRIVSYNTEHNHNPPAIHRTSDDFSYELIPSNKGKHPILLFDKYTFAQKGQRHWYCSKKLALGCQAKVYMDKEGRITYYDRSHNHDPPKIHRTSDGRCIRGKKMILCQGYTFALRGASLRCWYCSRKTTTNCQARIYFGKDDKPFKPRCLRVIEEVSTSCNIFLRLTGHLNDDAHARIFKTYDRWANNLSSHQRVGGHYLPWTFATLREMPVLSDRNSISNGGGIDGKGVGYSYSKHNNESISYFTSVFLRMWYLTSQARPFSCCCQVDHNLAVPFWGSYIMCARLWSSGRRVAFEQQGVIELVSRKGGKMLYYKGYTYSRHKAVRKQMLWRWFCSSHHAKGLSREPLHERVQRSGQKRGGTHTRSATVPHNLQWSIR